MSSKSVEQTSLLCRNGDVFRHACTFLPMEDLAIVNCVCRVMNTPRIWKGEASRYKAKALAYLKTKNIIEIDGVAVENIDHQQICRIGRHARVLEHFPVKFLAKLLNPEIAPGCVDRYFALPRIDSTRVSTINLQYDLKFMGTVLMPHHCFQRDGYPQQLMRRETENGPTIVFTAKVQTPIGLQFSVHEFHRPREGNSAPGVVSCSKPKPDFIPASLGETVDFSTEGIECRINHGIRNFEFLNKRERSSYRDAVENSFYPLGQIHPYEPFDTTDNF